MVTSGQRFSLTHGHTHTALSNSDLVIFRIPSVMIRVKWIEWAFTLILRNVEFLRCHKFL